MALKISKLRHKPGLALAGPLASGGLYSHYNLRLAAELDKSARYELGLFSDETEPNLPIPALKQALGRLPKELAWQIEHRSLPLLQAPDRGHWVLMQPWEYASLPLEWLPLFRFGADEIWVHTPNNLNAYLREGVDAERLALVPAGIDPEIFSPEGPQVDLPGAQPFRFLFVGESLWYSGLDHLLQAFYEEFLPDEPVSLLILDWTEAPLSARQPQLDKLQQLQQLPDCPAIMYFDSGLSETERAAMYRSCQSLVYPCRAEAFATQLIEAAACGLPQILTRLEGDYGLPASESLTWLSSRLSRQSERQIGGLPTQLEPTWSEINLPELRQQLRECFMQHQNGERVESQRQAALALSTEVRERYSWQKIAEQVQQRLEALSTQPIFRELQNQLQTDTLDALQALESGDSTQALKGLNTVLERSPDHPIVLLDLAGIHLQRQEYAQALPLLERALPLAPGHANLYHAAGIALFHLKAWKLAAEAFTRVLILQPEHQGSRESLPVALEQAGQPGDTSANYKAINAMLTAQPAAQARLTLALCMIVKNEESFLRQCLESVKAVVDEIVIVDTGSTDATPDIAREFGAKLVDFEWTGSFSEARNESLRHATADWILVLDADEVISPQTLQNLRSLIEMPIGGLGGYQLRIRNLQSDTNDVDAVEHYMMRLFPNQPELRFTGVIHEQLGPTDPELPFERMATPDVLVLHYGYTGQIMDSRDKYRRNLDLIRQSLETEPENPFHWFNLGLTHRINQEQDESLAALEKAVELSHALPALPTYMAACYSYIASILIEREEYAKARDFCDAAPEICRENPDFWVNLGSIHNGLGSYDEAIEAFEHAMSMRSRSFMAVVSDRAATTWKPYAGIGNTYLMQNNFDQADFYFRRALKENAHNPEILLGLGRLAMMRHQPAQALGYFDRLAAHPQATHMNATARFEAARAQLLLGEAEVAEAELLALLERENLGESLNLAVRSELSQLYLRQNRTIEAGKLLEGLTDSEALMQALARFYHQQGAHGKLLDLFNELIEKAETPRASDYRQRGTVYLLLENYAAARADFDQALALDPGEAESIHNLGVIALHQDQFSEARTYFEQALRINPELFESLLDLAKLDLHEQQPASARDRLYTARRIKPKHVELLELLAYTEYSLGRPELASEVYLDLIEIDPRHQEALTQLGYLLNEAGEHARAIQLFERALDLGASSAVLYNGVGLAFLELSRYTDARNAFLLALQQDPDNAEIQRAVALADQLCGQTPLELVSQAERG